ncbi:prolyl oligopeptidase family protein [Undibacterium oligocarboniphilum]|uniref:Peptidase S9A N-terminal domain-containing protein n=1 Tax=Undibacterium oligocarboniphilum TaxID=666702 RepID=A0A850QQ23_9BURK|nr:hypothetical protein [Undibacterium oligocarboniphilum]MBC3870185.1 hypothetical protein [Undibacterium oligocarboniphilum]NVO78176.1 hypothetical protein [Undibacterium oligocarboniphilum]
MHAQIQAWGNYPPVPRDTEDGKTGTGYDATDPLRLLENTSDPVIRSWLSRQNAITKNIIGLIAKPEPISSPVVMREEDTPPEPDAVWLDLKTLQVYTMTGSDGNTRILQRDKTFGTEKVWYVTSQGERIGKFFVSADKNKLAFLLTDSKNTLTSKLRFIQIDGGGLMKDMLNDVDGVLPAVIWRSDGQGVIYARWNQTGSTVKTEVRQHLLGQTVTRDQSIFPGKNKLKSVPGSSYRLQFSPDAALVLLELQQPGLAERSYFYARNSDINGLNTRWKSLATTSDRVRQVVLTADGWYILSVKKNPQGSILKIEPKVPQLSRAKLAVETDQSQVVELAVAANGLYWHARIGGTDKLMQSTLNGKNIKEVTLPFQGKLSRLQAGTSKSGASFVLESASVAPSAYRVSEQGEILPFAAQKTSMSLPFTEKRLSVKAADGRLLWATLISRNPLPSDDKLPHGPTLLQLEYDSADSSDLAYEASRLEWVRRYGTLIVFRWFPAVAMSRAAPAVRDDPAADVIRLIELLQKEHLVQPGTLLAQELISGRNAVLLAALRRPDLFAAMHVRNCLSQAESVTVVQKAENHGALRNTQKPAGNAAALTDSPYEQLRSGVAYPAMLFSATGEVGQAPVWMSAKMAAALQLLNTDKSHPVLLRTAPESADVADPTTDMVSGWAFLLWRAGERNFSLQAGKPGGKQPK